MSYDIRISTASIQMSDHTKQQLLIASNCMSALHSQYVVLLGREANAGRAVRAIDCDLITVRSVREGEMHQFGGQC